MLLLIPFVAQGADQFASAAFQQQWNTVEAVIPNFWGPLATARNGQTEQYAEGVLNGQPGVRLVQYFDKARMEQTNPDRPVTNGLLTVELKSGQLQTRRQQLPAAQPGIHRHRGRSERAGADLRIARATAGEDSAADGRRQPRLRSRRRRRLSRSRRPRTRRCSSSPTRAIPVAASGRTSRPRSGISCRPSPAGWLTTMGYPISPAFAATCAGEWHRDARLRAGVPAPRAHLYGDQSGGVPRRIRQYRPTLLRLAIRQATTTAVTAVPTTTATATATTVPATTAVPTTAVRQRRPTRGNPPTVPAPVGTTRPDSGCSAEPATVSRVGSEQ